MVIQFVNRTAELQFLEENYQKKGANLIVIYGRRRVGKTEILTHFIKKRNGMYLLATQDVEKEILTSFSKVVAHFYNDSALKVNPFFTCEQLLEYLQKQTEKTKEKIIIEIDEFPYLVCANNAIPSILQKYWDLFLKNENILLIICGSSISFMESRVLGQKSPLYGRRTGQWKVESLLYNDARKFFPNADTKKQMEFYCIVGGIPLYLLEFEEQKSSIENIMHHIARKGNILYDEVNFLLKEELREPKTYFSILREISNGKNKLNEISDAAGLERTSLTKYIQTLESLDIIEKYCPVTERKIKSKKVRYEIKDNYFTFWFKFIHQFRTDLEQGEYTTFLHYLHQELPSFVGKRFQRVCHEFLRKNLPFSITKIGTQWGKIPKTKNTYEIDIVLLHEQTKYIAFVECKWKDLTMTQSLKILEGLQEKATYMDWYKKERKEHFILIARKIEQKEKLRAKGFLVYDLDDWK